MNKPLLILFCCLLALPLAAAEGPGPWYGGVGLGAGDADVSPADFDDGSLTAGSIKTSGMTRSFFVGHPLPVSGLPFALAAEGGFIQFNKPELRATSDGTGTLWGTGAVASRGEADGIFAAAVARYPVGGGFDALARLGLLLWDSDQSLDNAVGRSGGPVLPTHTRSEDGADFFFGLGGEYRFMGRFAARLAWTRYGLAYATTGDVDIDVINLSVMAWF